MDIGGLPNFGTEYLDLLDGIASPGRSLGSVLDPQPNGKKPSVKEVAAAFEQILMESLVRAMRETVQNSELFGKGLGEEHYRGFLDSLYVEMAAKRGGFGLRDGLIRNLSGNVKK